MSWSAVRTVTVLELRQRVRSTRWQVMLGIRAAVLLVIFLGLGVVTTAFLTGSDSDWVPTILDDLIVCFVLGIGLVVAPTLSATSINGDRADATLALLQATALRPGEIVIGKLLAAWSAALAFLAVALPLLLILVVARGATLATLLAHLAILVVTLGGVCAIGLGFSATTARTSASAVLTYLVVTALTIGTPLATTMSAMMVRDPQTQFVYHDKYGGYESGTVCASEPVQREEEIIHGEWIWWMLAPNPFAALSDASTRTPARTLARGTRVA